MSYYIFLKQQKEPIRISNERGLALKTKLEDAMVSSEEFIEIEKDMFKKSEIKTIKYELDETSNKRKTIYFLRFKDRNAVLQMPDDKVNFESYQEAEKIRRTYRGADDLIVMEGSIRN